MRCGAARRPPWPWPPLRPASGLALVAPALTEKLYGTAYAPSALTLSVLALSLVPLFLNGLLTHALIAAEHASVLPRLTALRVVLAAALRRRARARGRGPGRRARVRRERVRARGARRTGRARGGLPGALARPALLALAASLPMAAAVCPCATTCPRPSLVGVLAYGATLAVPRAVAAPAPRTGLLLTCVKPDLHGEAIPAPSTGEGFCCPYCSGPLVPLGVGLRCEAEGRSFAVHRRRLSAARGDATDRAPAVPRARASACAATRAYEATPGLPEPPAGHRLAALWRSRARNLREGLRLAEAGPGPRALAGARGRGRLRVGRGGPGRGRSPRHRHRCQPGSARRPARRRALAGAGVLRWSWPKPTWRRCPWRPAASISCWRWTPSTTRGAIQRALVELRRVTRRGGALLVLESPVYARREDGEADVARRMRRLQRVLPSGAAAGDPGRVPRALRAARALRPGGLPARKGAPPFAGWARGRRPGGRAARPGRIARAAGAPGPARWLRREAPSPSTSPTSRRRCSGPGSRPGARVLDFGDLRGRVAEHLVAAGATRRAARREASEELTRQRRADRRRLRRSGRLGCRSCRARGLAGARARRARAGRLPAAPRSAGGAR